MNRKTVFLLLFTAFFVNEITYSQPAATFQLLAGYSFPLPDLKGSFGSTREQFTGNGNPDSNTYFMKPGLSYGIAVKVPINRKKFPINVIGSLNINQFSNKAEYNIGDTNFIKSEISQTITTFGAGLEYIHITRKSLINPYAGIKFTLNLFSGQYNETETYFNSDKTLNLVNTARLGIEANAGFDWVLHNNVGLTLAMRYSYANIIGKSTEKDTPSEYYLNDGEHTVEGITYPAKKITYLQIFGGVSFYFGR